jgi:hypothetical protein
MPPITSNVCQPGIQKSESDVEAIFNSCPGGGIRSTFDDGSLCPFLIGLPRRAFVGCLKVNEAPQKLAPDRDGYDGRLFMFLNY